MKYLKQSLEFALEVNLFVASGFLIAIGNNFSYLILIMAFIMAIITGRQIKRDAIKDFKGGLKNELY